jgi:DNA-binding NtrC family response regulator
MTKKVLIIEGSHPAQEALRAHLPSSEYEVTLCSSFAQVERLCRTTKPDIVVIGSHLAEGNAFDFLPQLQSIQPEAAIVLVPEANVNRTTEAVRVTSQQLATRTLHEMERCYIEEVLLLKGWRVQSAARELGIPRSSLYHKIKQYGLSRAVMHQH